MTNQEIKIKLQAILDRVKSDNKETVLSVSDNLDNEVSTVKNNINIQMALRKLISELEDIAFIKKEEMIIKYCPVCQVPEQIHSPTSCGWGNANIIINPINDLEKLWKMKSLEAKPNFYLSSSLPDQEQGKEAECCAFAEWILKSRFNKDGNICFRDYEGTGSHQFTPTQLYKLFITRKQ